MPDEFWQIARAVGRDGLAQQTSRHLQSIAPGTRDAHSASRNVTSDTAGSTRATA